MTLLNTGYFALGVALTAAAVVSVLGVPVFTIKDVDGKTYLLLVIATGMFFIPNYLLHDFTMLESLVGHPLARFYLHMQYSHMWSYLGFFLLTVYNLNRWGNMLSAVVLSVGSVAFIEFSYAIQHFIWLGFKPVVACINLYATLLLVLALPLVISRRFFILERKRLFVGVLLCAFLLQYSVLILPDIKGYSVSYWSEELGTFILNQKILDEGMSLGSWLFDFIQRGQKILFQLAFACIGRSYRWE